MTWSKNSLVGFMIKTRSPCSLGRVRPLECLLQKAAAWVSPRTEVTLQAEHGPAWCASLAVRRRYSEIQTAAQEDLRQSLDIRLATIEKGCNRSRDLRRVFEAPRCKQRGIIDSKDFVAVFRSAR
jgi:hypothetical protein